MKGINPTLLIGIGLPFFLILVLFVVIFVPSLFINPAYDFVYSDENPQGYYPQYRYSYELKDGHIAVRENTFRDKEAPRADYPALYLYDMKTNTARQLSFEEAQALSLLPGPASPDGYTVSYEYGSGGIFLFGGDSRGGYFIKKGTSGKQLSGLPRYGYYDNFSVLGWVRK